jgi:hypothetical protein
LQLFHLKNIILYKTIKISQNHPTRKSLLYLTISSLSAQPLSPPKTTKLNFCPNPSPHGSIPQDQKDLVLSLQRLTRSLYSYNPQIKELKLFAKKIW